jgi:hypothetical protein
MVNLIRAFLVICFILFLAGCEKADTGSLSSAEGSGGSSGYSLTGGGGSGGSGGGGGGTPRPAGVITAGEWNDNDNWSFWLGLMDTVSWKNKQEYWKLYPVNRYSVQLTDQSNNNIPDAEIIINDGLQTCVVRTDNFGKAEYFPALFTNTASAAYPVKARINGQEFDLGIFSPSLRTITKQLNINRSISNNVDIMFVVDATGSMGDELTYLQTELNDVLTRSQGELPGMTLRAGSVFYRDKGDEYVTRAFPFTTNISGLINFIKQQHASNGGDFPEAVHSALEAAMQQQNWSTGARSRLLFLVLDAPPHHEDAVISSIQLSIKTAQQKGIKIIPVTASGIDKETEFLMRFMSIATNGTYVFVTNDSGIGNPHLSPTVGSYQVEYLNNLMVRLIKKYSKL